ncbi:hemerythrin domain-containing protein [Micromonospora sp. NPDC050417]|uniref:hemerythrin domain-containing protein n=1 Tax=Micromonospora sp. NPDC050417 TaxID=3364280 RepID=UPI00379CACD7
MSLPLPPLPPTAGVDDDHYRPGGLSIVDLLTEEHARIGTLCRELADPALPVDQRHRVAEVLVATVTRHLSGEEQYLYPSVRSALPEGAAVADREIAADAALLHALRELSAATAGDPGYDEAVAQVTEQVTRHTRAATSEIFPALRTVASEADLIRLGNRVQIAEEAAPTRPHPDTPTTPPWNRIVEPAVGVVDKVRDAVTGRQTYLDDLPDGTRP